MTEHDPQSGGPADDVRPEPENGRIEEPLTPQSTVWRKWCIGLGVLMMLLTLVLSVLIPVQRDMLYVANRSMMALGGGLAAAGMLGFLHIEIKVVKQTVSAGGGLGVFVLLFLVNPPSLTALAAAPPTRKAQLQELESLVEPAAAPAGVIGGPTPVELRRVLAQEGFDSLRAFRVTATPQEIERVEDRLRERR